MKTLRMHSVMTTAIAVFVLTIHLVTGLCRVFA